MLTDNQKKWQIEQWTAFLSAQEVPIMPRSKLLIQCMAEQGAETVGARELTPIVTGDPFLALRSLRHAESGRSRTLGRETTTPLASLMQIGVEGLCHLVEKAPLCDDFCVGLCHCEFSSTTASYIARSWASHRADVSPDEIALAALLSDIGEMMLWHFAPELPEKVNAVLQGGSILRPVQAQQLAIGFSFKSLSLTLAQAWNLPPLITQLIRGVDNVRANIARLANVTAKHVQINPNNPALPSDIVNIRDFVMVSDEKLLAPLPVSDEYKQTILNAIRKDCA